MLAYNQIFGTKYNIMIQLFKNTLTLHSTIMKKALSAKKHIAIQYTCYIQTKHTFKHTQAYLLHVKIKIKSNYTLQT